MSGVFDSGADRFAISGHHDTPEDRSGAGQAGLVQHGKSRHPGKENEGNTSNAGFVVTSEGVVVFDALGTPSLGWALLQEIRKITDRKIRYVVASHYHADHIYGLQAFRDRTEAIIVAQERSGEYKDNEETADEERVSASISGAPRCFRGSTAIPA